MRRSWAVSPFLLLTLVACGCGRGKDPSAVAKPTVGSQEILDGWMGRFGRRDEGLRILLSSQEGWGSFRDMDLEDAAELFQARGSDADRVGAARSYLELASLHEALEGLLFELDSEYLDSLGSSARPEDRARGGLAKLLRGDLVAARTLFRGEAPPRLKAVWAIGAAGLAAKEGRRAEAESLAEKALAEAKRGAERALVQVACWAWGLPSPDSDSDARVKAAAALRRGDPSGALRALEAESFHSNSRTPGADLFTYLLYRRAYGALALAAVGPSESSEVAFWAGQAKEYLGDDTGAATLYARASQASGPGTDPAWVFSPVAGAAEGARLASVFRGGALHRSGQVAQGLALWQKIADSKDPGPLVTSALALQQTRFGRGSPYKEPVKEASASLQAVRASLEAMPGLDVDNLLPTVFPTRVSAVSRAAAEVFRRGGDRRAALDTLERAHRKATGYRPDFVNPPAFLVELARAYAESGEYASAVGVLYELRRQYAAAGPVYESMKRLYATRAGGGAAPKY